MSWTIGEVAEKLSVAPSTLRYYETEGLLPALERTPSGRRRFTERDLEACRVIDCLKRSGLSIQQIKQFMALVLQGDATLADRLAMFQDRRQAVQHEMEQLQALVGVLDFKAWYYEQALAAGSEQAVSSLGEDDVPAEHRAAKAYLTGKVLP